MTGTLPPGVLSSFPDLAALALAYNQGVLLIPPTHALHQVCKHHMHLRISMASANAFQLLLSCVSLHILDTCASNTGLCLTCIMAWVAVHMASTGLNFQRFVCSLI